jgi:hypothetical protein
LQGIKALRCYGQDTGFRPSATGFDVNHDVSHVIL